MSESNFVGISVGEFLSIIKIHFRLLLTVVLIIITLSLGYALTRVPLSTASVVVEIVPLPGIKTEAIIGDEEIACIQSRETVSQALQSLDLSQFKSYKNEDYGDLLFKEKLLFEVMSIVDVSHIAKTNQLRLSFIHTDSKFAHSFLESLVNSFSKKYPSLYTERLETQYALQKSKLEDAMAALIAFEFSYKDLPFSTILIDAITSIENSQKIISFLDNKIQDVSSISLESDALQIMQSFGIASPVATKLFEDYREAYKNLIAQEINQIVMTGNQEEEDRSIVIYRHNLENRKENILSQMKLVNSENYVEKRVLEIANAIELTILVSEKQYYLDRNKENISIRDKQVKNINELNLLRSNVVKYNKELKVFEELRSNDDELVSIAVPLKTVGDGRTTKNLLIVMIGTVVGVVVGLLIVLIYDFGSDTIYSDIFIKTSLSNKVSFLHEVPTTKKKKKGGAKAQNVFSPAKSTLKAYDQLAGIIQHGLNPTETPVFCISSLGYGEGSIALVVNTALSLSKTGKRVLVLGTNSSEVDYPKIYSEIMESYPFVKNNHAENNQLDFIKDLSTKSPFVNLDYLDLEPIELSFFLNSGGLSEYLEGLAQVYDLILIDGPTFQAPSDLLAVGKITGGLILNISQGISSKKNLTELMKDMAFTKVPVVGVVFTGIH